MSQFFRAVFRGCGQTVGVQYVHNGVGIRLGEHPAFGSGTADNGRTNGNCLAVGDGKLAFCLYAVANSVPKVQLHPGTGVKFVLGNDIPLQLHTPADDLFPVEGNAGASEIIKKVPVIENAIFDDLSAAVSENFIGQSA